MTDHRQRKKYLAEDDGFESSVDSAEDARDVEVEAEASDCDRISHLDIVVLGPPGSGKGTQADALSKALCLAHIAELDLIRQNVALGTALGELALGYVTDGHEVPNDIAEAMVEERIGAPDTVHGFVLDGFPHVVEQAEVLGRAVHAMNRRIAGVLFIDLDEEEIQKRLAGRLVCERCGRPYHLQFKKPKQKRTCDVCQGKLTQHEDDTPAGIAKRMAEYRRMTQPVVDYYRKNGLLIEIDGSGELGRVTERAIAAAKSLIGPSPLH